MGDAPASGVPYPAAGEAWEDGNFTSTPSGAISNGLCVAGALLMTEGASPPHPLTKAASIMPAATPTATWSIWGRATFFHTFTPFFSSSIGRSMTAPAATTIVTGVSCFVNAAATAMAGKTMYHAR